MDQFSYELHIPMEAERSIDIRSYRFDLRSYFGRCREYTHRFRDRCKRCRFEFASHKRIRHSIGEYGRGDVYTNTIEGFFSIFKRGMRGVYQHCREKHLHRYLAEFDFRYTNRAGLGCNDADRADPMLAGVVGKRLTYRTIGMR